MYRHREQRCGERCAKGGRALWVRMLRVINLEHLTAEDIRWGDLDTYAVFSRLRRVHNRCHYVSRTFPSSILHINLEQLLGEAREGNLQSLIRQAHDQRNAHVKHGRFPGIFQHCPSPFSPKNRAGRHELLDDRIGYLFRDNATRICTHKIFRRERGGGGVLICHLPSYEQQQLELST